MNKEQQTPDGQDLISAIERQRNEAMNALVLASATIASLRRRIDELEDKQTDQNAS